MSLLSNQPNTLIDATYMKKYDLANSDIDSDRITACIIKAQRQYIRPLLGKDLYNKMVTDNINNNIVYPYDELLAEYIAPCLSTYTLLRLRPFITHEITNKGSQYKSSDYSQASSDSSLKWLYDLDILDANSQAEALLETLRCNRDLFPEYDMSGQPSKGGLYTGPALEYNPYIDGRRVNINGLWRGRI